MVDRADIPAHPWFQRRRRRSSACSRRRCAGTRRWRSGARATGRPAYRSTSGSSAWPPGRAREARDLELSSRPRTSASRKPPPRSRRSHCVLRAPKGDGYGTIMLAMFERLGVMPPLSVCAMSEATLAGAAANIPAVLREIDARLSPELIVVTRSATATVLQEPLDGEVSMMAPGDVKAEIFFASAHPVATRKSSAFALTTRELVAHFAKDAGRTRTAVGQHHRPVAARLPRSQQHRVAAPDVRHARHRKSTPSCRWVRRPTTCGRSAAPGSTCHGARVGQADARVLETASARRTSNELPYGEAGTTRFLREMCALLRNPAGRIAAAARESQPALVRAHGRRARALGQARRGFRNADDRRGHRARAARRTRHAGRVRRHLRGGVRRIGCASALRTSRRTS